MAIKGEMFIGSRAVKGTTRQHFALNAATGERLEPTFYGGGAVEVEQACLLAEQAFNAFRNTDLEVRATFLESIATGIMALGDELIERAALESGLPIARLQSERGRTVGQLQLFARVVRDGHWLDATIDRALPNRTPPRSDLRMQKIALGPVAVFGASNFPLAFSVAGGDTASAFAAGCPVVVKAHSAHLGTSELVGRAIQEAVAKVGLPEGVFSMLVGAGESMGIALVSNAAIKAVGFTGSRAGGLALIEAANRRPEPIPVFAEMSSVNPVFVLPVACRQRGEEIAKGFADSLVLGVGQFCTNPGLVITVEGPHLHAFRQAAVSAIESKASATMLTPRIHTAYVENLAQLSSIPTVLERARGKAANGPHEGQTLLYETTGESFLADQRLEMEIFGPASLLVVCKDQDEMLAIAHHIHGQLTATIHANPQDHAIAASLLPVLERKAGRILFNGYPTGVEVTFAMVHGGPFPATADSRSTSVGAAAIERFLRPVCYQDFPADLLPVALRDDNPLSILRLVDGVRA